MIRLKLSSPMLTTAKSWAVRRACASSMPMRSASSRRLGSPVRASWVARWRSSSWAARLADTSRPTTSMSPACPGASRRASDRSNQAPPPLHSMRTVTRWGSASGAAPSAPWSAGAASAASRVPAAMPSKAWLRRLAWLIIPARSTRKTSSPAASIKWSAWGEGRLCGGGDACAILKISSLVAMQDLSEARGRTGRHHQKLQIRRQMYHRSAVKNGNILSLPFIAILFDMDQPAY